MAAHRILELNDADVGVRGQAIIGSSVLVEKLCGTRNTRRLTAHVFRFCSSSSIRANACAASISSPALCAAASSFWIPGKGSAVIPRREKCSCGRKKRERVVSLIYRRLEEGQEPTAPGGYDPILC